MRALVVVAMLLAGARAEAKPAQLRTRHFVIRYQNLTPEMASRFSVEAEEAFTKVTTYLGRGHDRRNIPIEISDEIKLPNTTLEGEIHLPANRIRGDAGGPADIAGRGPAIAHELTHLVQRGMRRRDRAPAAPELGEGLAVYVQEKFETGKSYPNMGVEVHLATARMARKVGKLVPLLEVGELRDSTREEPLRRLAYLEEGSFVKFLVETYGLPSYLDVYRGKTYEAVYRKSVPELEAQWRRLLAGIEVDSGPPR